MSIDRLNRIRLAESMERYLGDEITAFDFNERIFAIRDASRDPTIDRTVELLWHFYDDLTDHKVVATKPLWDLAQRLLLMLRSNAQLEIDRRRHWHPTQVIAAAALLLFVIFSVSMGFGCQLFALAVPFGVVSIIISLCRPEEAMSADQTAIWPFSSIRQIARIRRNVPEFRKHRYPVHLQGRRIREHDPELQSQITTYAAWILFSPLVLLVQCFPRPATLTRVEVR